MFSTSRAVFLMPVNMALTWVVCTKLTNSTTTTTITTTTTTTTTTLADERSYSTLGPVST